MFALFGTISQCVPFLGTDVLTLTDRNFGKIIDSRKKTDLYVVMFHGPRCPACERSYPTFTSVSQKLKGIAALGHVDCSRQRRTCSRFAIAMIPAFYVFHARGHTSVNSLFRLESCLINGVMKCLPTDPEPVNGSWAPGGQVANSAILFTGKWSLPFYWKAIATYFSGTPIRIGFVNDRKTKKLFNCTRDTLKLISGTNVVDHFVSDPSFLELNSAIEQNFRDLLGRQRSAREPEDHHEEL
jgi:thiol-disulfide isomerase/thioredoxin